MSLQSLLWWIRSFTEVLQFPHKVFWFFWHLHGFVYIYFLFTFCFLVPKKSFLNLLTGLHQFTLISYIFFLRASMPWWRKILNNKDIFSLKNYLISMTSPYNNIKSFYVHLNFWCTLENFKYDPLLLSIWWSHTINFNIIFVQIFQKYNTACSWQTTNLTLVKYKIVTWKLKLEILTFWILTFIQVISIIKDQNFLYTVCTTSHYSLVSFSNSLKDRI